MRLRPTRLQQLYTMRAMLDEWIHFYEHCKYSVGGRACPGVAA